MNKVLLVALLLVVLLSSCIFYVLKQTNEREREGLSANINDNSPSNENQAYNVKITDLKWTSRWEAVVGTEAAISFNLTIQNNGTRDVNGATVGAKVLDANSSEIHTETMFYGSGIIGNGAQLMPFNDTLYAGETRTFKGVILADWGAMANAWALGTTTVVVDVKLNGTVLDELTVTQL